MAKGPIGITTGTKAPEKTTDEQLADLLLKKNEEKQTRVKRCGDALNELLSKERVTIMVSSFNITDGRISPVIQLVAMD
jgi:hypothetical protein